MTVLRHATDDEVAAAVASALVAALVDVQAAGREPSVVLTGGTIARKVHRAVASHPDRDRVDWSAVRVWWGDERFVAADDEERNEGQARADLLDRLPFDPDKIHARRGGRRVVERRGRRGGVRGRARERAAVRGRAVVRRAHARDRA